MRYPAAILALLLATAPLSARAAEAAADVPACPLLAPAEVAAALGEAVAAAERPPSGGAPGTGRMTTCLWTPEDGRPGATLSLIVWSWPPGHPAAAGWLEPFREPHPDRPAPEDAAIGDGAVWDGDRLHVLKGDIGFTLATSLNALDPTPDAQAKLGRLARIVAGRLP